VSQRTLLIAALALMAGGLLFGVAGVVLGDGSSPADSQSQQGAGFPGQRGPAGGFRPYRPGFAPGQRPGGGTWRIIPSPPASPGA
jgi:hypothetical protein